MENHIEKERLRINLFRKIAEVIDSQAKDNDLCLHDVINALSNIILNLLIDHVPNKKNAILIIDDISASIKDNFPE